jgi:mannose-6-phosphate isomerase-like protein (cupin superfamily)
MKVFPTRVLAAVRIASIAAMALASSAGLAQAPAGDPPLAFTAGEKSLKWGPCPDFLPKGCRIAVLHGDPSKNNVDVFFQVPGKAKIASHWHTSAERMVLVTGRMSVAYEGHKPVTLDVGSYAYGPAKAPHSAECLSEGPCTLFIAFESPLDAVPTEKPGAAPAKKAPEKKK